MRTSVTTPLLTLAGGTQARVAAGLHLETGVTRVAARRTMSIFCRERGQDREAAMREYLAWEINLVDDMAKDDDHRFRIAAGYTSEHQ